MKGSTSSDVFDLVGNTALYEVLGLTRDASERDIRRAYYRIAIVYHPDKNPDGEEIFKEGRAKEYDPEMDPTVDLTPDDLRRFVDKLKSTSDSKKKKLSDFELRREEEMKRRAEYDAKQPGFKVEYERQRELRKQRATRMLDSKRGESLALTTGLRFRTCAEMTGALQEEETRRRRGERISSPNRHSTKLVNMKEDLLQQYRAGELRGGGEKSRRNGDIGTEGSDMDMALTKPRGNLEFVRKHEEQAGSAYSATVDETLKKYRNYDYLDSVVNDKEDKLEMDGAILADALSLYDSKN